MKIKTPKNLTPEQKEELENDLRKIDEMYFNGVIIVSFIAISVLLYILS